MITLPAIELARRIRTRETTAVAVLDAHLRRTRAVNPSINALIVERFDDARAEAEAADRRVREATDPSRLPPFLGVPCTIKSFLAFPGFPWTGALVARKDCVADHEAVVVTRLRESGAVIIGATNAPEGGIWIETYNRINGWTNNPHDPRRSPGGSSGGESAMVAAGASPMGIGSDLGGSIRFPAAFCGVVGHKGTGGLVPNHGHLPNGGMGRFLCVGPLTRTVDDAAALLRVIAGPTPLDETVEAMAIGDHRTTRVRRVFSLPPPGRLRVRPSMLGAQDRAVRAIVAAGAEQEEITLPHWRNALEVWAAGISEVGGTTYREVLGDGKPIPVGRELAKLLFRRSNHTLPALVLCILEQIVDRLPGRVEEMIAAGKELQAALESALGDDGVLVVPPYSRSAPRHRGPILTVFDFTACALFNVLETPATVVPAGVDTNGMPLSVQIVASRRRDAVALAAARLVEEAHGGFHVANYHEHSTGP